MSISSDPTTDSPLSQQLTRTEKNRLHWKSVIAEWENSRLTPSEFCKSRGLNTAQFTYYRKSLAEKKPQPGKMIPIEINTQKGHANEDSTEPLTLYLSNRVKLDIPRSCNVYILTKIFSAVRAIAC